MHDNFEDVVGGYFASHDICPALKARVVKPEVKQRKLSSTLDFLCQLDWCVYRSCV